MRSDLCFLNVIDFGNVGRFWGRSLKRCNKNDGMWGNTGGLKFRGEVGGETGLGETLGDEEHDLEEVGDEVDDLELSSLRQAFVINMSPSLPSPELH